MENRLDLSCLDAAHTPMHTLEMRTPRATNVDKADDKAGYR